MASELAMKPKEIESQVANHTRNLQMELESYQQRLGEEQDIARRATVQGDRSEDAEWQIVNDAIARISVSVISLSDTTATYKKLSTSYVPTGKVVAGSTLRAIDRKHNVILCIETYPTGLGNAKISVISAATPLEVVVLGRSKGIEITMKAPLGYIPYYTEEVPRAVVYVVSLSLVAKKVLGPKCHQSSINGIIDTISADPAVSNMDVVLLGPSDLTGSAGKKIPETVTKRHKGVCVIYLYTNDHEAELLRDAPYVKQVKKIKGIVTAEAVTEFYGEDIKMVDPKYHSGADRVGDLDDNPKPSKPVSLTKSKPAEEVPVEPSRNVESDLPPIDGVTPTGEQPTPSSEAEQPKALSAEDVIGSIRTVKDWGILKEQINRDSIIRQLTLESSEFAGVANMLEVWDLHIRDIWADNHKSNEGKMEAVQEFSANRQVLQATYNNVLVDKLVSLMERVISICSSTVEDRCNEIVDAITSIHQNKDTFLERAVSGKDSLDDILYERMVELQSTEGELRKTFVFLYHEGMEEIVTRLGEKLPSDNEHINNMLSVSSKLFQPNNTVDLVQSIPNALAKGQMQLPLIEDRIKDLMDTMFQVIVEQNRIIQYQHDAISCLRASNMESFAMHDSLLKGCFDAIIGSEHTGFTATSAIYAGILSRRDNTLVADPTGHSHYGRYGYDVVQLDGFMVERKQQPLLFVTGSVGSDPKRVLHLMEEFKSRLAYFRHFIVILDTAQLDTLDQVGQEALSISYVTNRTVENVANVTSTYETGCKIPNVCHRLICVNSPVNVGILVSTLKIDTFITELIPIPYLREIKQVAVVRQQLHTYNDILCVFEEASRA